MKTNENSHTINSANNHYNDINNSNNNGETKQRALPELTFKAIILSILLTILLGAANAYLGLKVGITISASIPAAVISMGVLRLFRNSNVLENNIVQTAASAGEALTSGIVYTIPALIILHVWAGFHYLATVTVAIVGGVLGVLFSIPLRRVMLQHKALRFPEGTAIGNVLLASTNAETGFKDLVNGGLVGAIISFAQIGLEAISSGIQRWWVVNNDTLIGFGAGFSPALIAAGFIVGIDVAISELIGTFIGWFGGVPIASHLYGVAPNVTDQAVVAAAIWKQHCRLIGIGTMLVGGIYTMITLLKPMTEGLIASWQTMRHLKEGGNYHDLPRTERDIPLHYVLWFVLILAVPIIYIMWHICQTHLPMLSNVFHLNLALVCTVTVLALGFVCASICAYLAGLVGSSTSPISGITLIGLLLSSFILVVILYPALGHANLISNGAGVTVAIVMCALIAGTSAISNDTMQDLKAGQMVGATPWKQQFMLIVGVCISAVTIPLILELLFNAYGIGGVFPHAGMSTTQTLSAPQAGLMATVASGVFRNELSMNLLLIGALVAVVAIVLDKILKPHGIRLYVLAFGLGIYLPLDTSTPLIIGGFVSWLINRRIRKLEEQQVFTPEISAEQHQNGLLLACGLVAGSALVGVLLAIPFALEGSSDALRIVGPNFTPIADILGVVVTVLLCLWMYRINCVRKIKT